MENNFIQKDKEWDALQKEIQQFVGYDPNRGKVYFVIDPFSEQYSSGKWIYSEIKTAFEKFKIKYPKKLK